MAKIPKFTARPSFTFSDFSDEYSDRDTVIQRLAAEKFYSKKHTGTLSSWLMQLVYKEIERELRASDSGGQGDFNSAPVGAVVVRESSLPVQAKVVSKGVMGNDDLRSDDWLIDREAVVPVAKAVLRDQGVVGSIPLRVDSMDADDCLLPDEAAVEAVEAVEAAVGANDFDDISGFEPVTLTGQADKKRRNPLPAGLSGLVMIRD